jgi:hypothetical protein
VKVANVITGLVITTYALVAAWTFGIIRAASAVIGFPKNEKGEDPYDKIRRLELPFAPVMLVYGGTLLYVWLLTLLPGPK